MAYALETVGLARRFGGLLATRDVSLQVKQGARHALIGPNGAGKTTIINLLTGVLRPDAGKVLLDGADVTRLSPPARVRRGLARTFQINQLFAEMTPRQAIAVAVGEKEGRGFAWWSSLGADRGAADAVDAILAQFDLTAAAATPTRMLPYGKQRMLEIAIAIACGPRVLLLDEPAAGVPEGDRHALLQTIARLPKDVTVLLVEHDMNLVFSFADRITVLVNGAVFADGTPEAIAADPRVKAVYLGEDAGAFAHA